MKYAGCHPDRAYWARDLCKQCYQKQNIEKFRLKNPDYVRQANKQWHLDNPDYGEKWRLDNPDYEKQRYALAITRGTCLTHTDRPAVVRSMCWECQLKHNARSRIRKGLKSKNVTKSEHTDVMLGCTWAEYRIYLESLFLPGMTLENMGNKGWHIDHIRPLASFDLSDPEQQKLAFNYANTQPLWATDNRKKSDKWASPSLSLL